MENFFRALAVFALLCISVVALDTYLHAGATSSVRMSADAGNIVSDLRSCKAAALMCIADNTVSPDKLPYLAPRVNHIERVAVYTDNPERIIANGYMLYVSGDAWWVGFRLKDERVREKLESYAKTVGLYGTSDPTAPPVSDDQSGLYKKEDSAVWMRAR